MARWWPRTRLWQLGLALMVMQAIGAVAFGIYTFFTLRHFHHDQAREQLVQLVPLVSTAVQPLLSGPQTDEIDALTRRLGRTTGVRFTVVAPDGRVISDSAFDPATLQDHRFFQEIDRAFRGETGSAVRFSRALDMEVLYVAALVGDTRQPLGVVRAALPLAAVDAELGRVGRLVAVAGLALVALTFAVLYLISANLGRSVSSLVRGTRRFAAGEFDHRVRGPAGSELATVIRSFNRAADQLAGHIAQLEAQQREQQTILQSMRNAVVALDGEQRVISINRAGERLFGVQGRSARGRLLHEVVREPALHRFVAGGMASGLRSKAELDVGPPPRRTIEATGEPLQDVEGRTVGLLLVMNDVTQLRRLESIRSDFAANVSHELQTPITAIKGYVETLLEVEAPWSSEARGFLEIVHRNTNRLAAIIEDLLALARLEEPDTARTLERVETAILPLLDSVAGQFEAVAAEKAITLKRDAPAGLRALVNARLVEQAVSNLVSNAVKYAPRESTVTLGARRTDGTLEITVTDEGPGISAEHLPRLFERFYRVDRARSRALGGTGLGLAIVKHIAMVHGGHAEAESTVGRGSSFMVILPDAVLPTL